MAALLFSAASRIFFLLDVGRSIFPHNPHEWTTEWQGMLHNMCFGRILGWVLALSFIVLLIALASYSPSNSTPNWEWDRVYWHETLP